MLLNYLKIAVRNLRRDRLFSIINTSGLAMGIAAFMLIITYCLNALQYDNFHDGYKSIYRVVSKSTDETDNGKLYLLGIGETRERKGQWMGISTIM